MEKYGFIYLWYDRKRKMYYLGSHWGTIDDGYICSSNRMRDANRRRPQDFKRRIVEIVEKREILFDIEHKWLGMIAESELGKKYYNLRKHRWGHWSTDIDSRKTIGEKISVSKKGRNSTKVAAKKGSLKMLEKGTHNFQNRKWARERELKRVKKGSHLFLGGEIQRKNALERVEKGTHHFQHQEKVECPHCGKIGNKSLMLRWHFDKCKQKGEENEE